MNKSEIIDIDTEGLNLVLNDINKNMKPENVRKTINDVFGKVGELSKKKQEAIQKAKSADDKVRNQKDYKWYNKKESIVDLQETTREINDALQAQTEAQTLTFQYQESLANMSKLLFQLGVMNIAMNRQVVRELKLSLEGGNSSELDELACQEVQNVIDQLLAQEDLMVKQEKLNDAVIDMRDTVDDHDVRLEDIEKTTKKQETLIQKRIKHEKSQDEAIAAGERKDAEQDAILELQKLKDEEHDRAIASGEKKDEEQDAILELQKLKDEEHDRAIAAGEKKDIEQDELISKLNNRIELINSTLDESRNEINSLREVISSLNQQVEKKQNKLLGYISAGMAFVALVVAIVTMIIK